MNWREGAEPYLGREPQLERLADLLGAAAAGEGGFAVLRAAAGAGITATLREAAARADEAGFAVLWGSCSEGLAGRPFDALAEALEDHSRRTEPGALYVELGDAAPALARLAPQLRASLPAVPPPAPLEAPTEMLRIGDAVLGWLARAAAQRPLLLVLDDVQWLDRDLARVIERAARLLRTTTPVLILGGLADGPRGEQAESVMELVDAGLAEVIELPGLDEGATGALLARHADVPLSGAALELIQQASGGQPLGALELYRHLREEGLLGRPGGDALPSVDEVPQALEATVSWRLARLSLEERTALGALACFPVPASAAQVAAVSGLNRPRAAEALESGVRHGLLRSPEMSAVYEPVHPRIAAAIRDALSAGVRHEALCRVAETLELDLGAAARQQAALLASLYGQAIADGAAGRLSGDRARAGLRHCLVAAEQARAASAFARAADLLELGYRLAQAGGQATTELGLRVAVAMAEADRPAPTLVALEAAGGPGVRDVDALVDVVRALLAHGRAEAAETVRRKALPLAEASALGSARLQLLGGRWQHDRADGLELLVWQAEEDQATERTILGAGDEPDRSELFAAQRSRTHEQTVTLLNLARSWRRPSSLLRALHGASVDLLTRLGQLREARSWTAEYAAAAERYGSPLDLVRARLLLAQCQAALGELAAASETLALATEASATLPPAADPAVERLAAELALAHYLDGDWPALLGRLDAALTEPTPAAALLGAERALATARAGEGARDRQLPGDQADQVLELVARWPPLTYLRDSAMLVALTAEWESGSARHTPRGHGLVELSMAAGAGGNHAATPGLALARLGALAGALDEARARFAAQREALDAAGLRPLRAIVEHDEAIALGAAGSDHHGPAGALLESAIGAFRELGMSGWAERSMRLLEAGLEAAGQPGGRLHFSYPAGLSRREAELVRVLAAGATLASAAERLDLDIAAAERHLASAMDKLGAADPGELPALARRQGIGGGA